LDGIVYQAEKMVRENRDKIAEAEAKSLQDSIDDAKKAMSEGGTARLRSATENLEGQLQKVAEVLYRASQTAGAAQAGAAGAGAGASGGPAGGGSQQKKPDDVIDAEYVDVDENKRPN
jgi:molecular chaperone DnaK